MKFAFLLLALALSASAAWSQTPESGGGTRPSPDDVMALFNLMHIREQTATIMKGSENQTIATVRDLVQKRVPNITEAQLSELEGMIAELYRHYPVDQLLQDMVPVYQKHLTKADVDGISAFYSSPPGQKLLHETPAMTSEAMQISMARMQLDTEDILVQLDQRIQKMAEENNPKPSPHKGTARKPVQPQK